MVQGQHADAGVLLYAAAEMSATRLTQPQLIRVIKPSGISYNNSPTAPTLIPVVPLSSPHAAAAGTALPKLSSSQVTGHATPQPATLMGNSNSPRSVLPSVATPPATSYRPPAIIAPTAPVGVVPRVHAAPVWYQLPPVSGSAAGTQPARVISHPLKPAPIIKPAADIVRKHFEIVNQEFWGCYGVRQTQMCLLEFF